MTHSQVKQGVWSRRNGQTVAKEQRAVQLFHKGARPHNALHFCCRGVRRSRASQQENIPARLRRAHAAVSSKCGLDSSSEWSEGCASLLQGNLLCDQRAEPLL